jgi:5-methylcytosine-specific restriction protein A
MKIMLCNVGWLKYYEGCGDTEREYYNPLNGGEYNENNEGWESENFFDFDGYCYGCVQLPKYGKICNLKKNFCLDYNVDELDGVTVIWTANAKGSPLERYNRIVGWYKNATVYKHLQRYDEYDKPYRIKAKSEDCVCVPENERHFIIRPIRNTMYYPNRKDSVFQECLDYINGVISINENNTEKEHTEGELRHALLEYRTRNSVVVREAKKQYKLKNNGSLPCEVCEFDFFDEYGELGLDFIEAHHKKPHAKQGERAIKVSDFSLVCSNCHRVLHRNEGLTVERLRKIMLSK